MLRTFLRNASALNPLDAPVFAVADRRQRRALAAGPDPRVPAGIRGRAIDLKTSTFLLQYPDGARTEAQYDSLEDLMVVTKRAANTLAFNIAPGSLEWIDAATYALELIPVGMDLFISPRLAEVLQRAALPGIQVLPPRETATVVA